MRQFSQPDKRPGHLVQAGFWLLCGMLIGPLAYASLAGYVMRSDAMLPTIRPGESAVLDMAAYRSCGPQYGDIVAVRFRSLGAPIITRVLALPGDSLRVTRAGLLRNEFPISEPYLERPREWLAPRYQSLLDQLHAAGGAVPARYLLVLDDNPGSHRHDLVLRDQVIGRVVAVRDAQGREVQRQGLPGLAEIAPQGVGGSPCPESP